MRISKAAENWRATNSAALRVHFTRLLSLRVSHDLENEIDQWQDLDAQTCGRQWHLFSRSPVRQPCNEISEQQRDCVSGRATLVGRPSGLGEIHRRVDQSHVRERLRIVPSRPPRIDMIGFGEQPNVAANVEDSFEHAARVFESARQGQIVGEPERTQEKGRLAWRQTVNLRSRLISRDEVIADQVPLNRTQRSAHALILGGKKPTRGISNRLASRCVLP